MSNPVLEVFEKYEAFFRKEGVTPCSWISFHEMPNSAPAILAQAYASLLAAKELWWKGQTPSAARYLAVVRGYLLATKCFEIEEIFADARKTILFGSTHEQVFEASQHKYAIGTKAETDAIRESEILTAADFSITVY